MITAERLLAQVGLEPDGCVAWGEGVPCSHPGVYVIESERSFARAPISRSRVEAWLTRAPRLTLDGERPAAAALVARLSKFWLPLLRVLYIGQTEDALDRRLADFVGHELGRRSPHRGGHWIKTLKPEVGLRVWWVRAAKPVGAERRLLMAFSGSGGPAGPYLPFANLRSHLGSLRPHGLRFQAE